MDDVRNIMLAAESGNMDKMREYILSEAIDIVDEEGSTPLMYAAANGQEKVVRLLLQSDVDVDQQNHYGWTALLQASCYGHHEVVYTLLQNKADINMYNKWEISPLVAAAQGGFTTVVKVLLEKGATVTTSDEVPLISPLMAAAQCGSESIIKLLLDHGSNPNMRLMTTGWTALMLASLNNHAPVIRELLRRGAVREMRDVNNNRAIDLASELGLTSVVAILSEDVTRCRRASSSSSSSCELDIACPSHKNKGEERRMRRNRQNGGKDNLHKNNSSAAQKLGVRSLREDGVIRSQLQSSSLLSRDQDPLRKKSKRTETKGRKERDLEEERERRWKAEQAAVKLAKHVRSLQLQVHQYQQKHDLMVAQCSKLESSLVKEREQCSKAMQDREHLQDSQSEMKIELDELKKRCVDQSNLLRELESQLDRLDRERLQQPQGLREAEIRCATSERETLMQEPTASRLQQQIHDLQELLATKERDHQKELSKLKPPDCHDFRSMVDREVEREKVRIEGIVDQLKQRLEQQQNSYRDLEEEYRTALRMEASRYQKLEQSHEKMATEFTSCQEALETLREKDNKSTGLVTELTTIAKEQKSRLVDLMSGRQEMLRELKEKTKLLEEEMKTKNKFEERHSAAQEENGRLLAKLSAQESVISGLREECKLWGQELAIHGASLAQDRGRMEGQIDSLNREVKELGETLENASTALRVKDKVIEDEAKTIRALKEQVQNHKTELSSLQSEWSNRLESVQNQFDQERATCRDVHDQLGLMAETKLSLEDHLQEMEEREAMWKEKYRSLKSQWEERVSVIAALEESVHQLQEKSKQRQQQLEVERDHALEETREYRKKLDHAKQVYKEQLITQETLMRKKMEEEAQEKEREVFEAQKKVEEMEKEMRALLGETAKERKTMEEKFQRLSRTFHELQKELT